MWSEFKPAFSFLAKFLAIYFIGNLFYGLYVESLGQRADVLTEWVTEQTAFGLRLIGNETYAEVSSDSPKVYLKSSGNTVLNVFEGCNGINVMIIFVAFIFAFGGRRKAMMIFIPSGLLIIHLFNLLRIALLFFVAQHFQRYFYYTHKYLFTAVLYLVVFALWALWVYKFNATRKRSPAV